MIRPFSSQRPWAAALLTGGALSAVIGGGALAQSPTASPAAASLAPAGTTVRLLTHSAFALSQPVLDSFQQQTGATISVVAAADAGLAVNQAILTASNPIADVLYGVDDTFLSRALDAGIFEAYQPAAISGVPAALDLDPGGRVTPIDYGDVCINFDTAALEERGLTPPTTIEQLTQPAWKGTLVVEDPGVSSPGLAFVLATIDRFGESGSYTWRDYWADLRANDVQVASSWDDAYYGAFSGGAGEGDRPLVVSYASSPVAEVHYADPQPSTPPAEAPTRALLDSCYRQVEFAGVLAGTPEPGLARSLVDFLLSQPVQEDIPLNMFVFPALTSAVLPPVFQAYAELPADPVTMDPATIAANRDRWIEEWTQTVLR
ncbi:MAG: thiamine ABC transporter substrate-binding protein [Chloroflexi bacterium]|nr:thiamine ABC transporter substrate-binding protein [Chloroflexota bacterium]